MEPKISVVIPAYNAEAFIRKALHCVFEQELQPHEIIVVNDGSKDGTQRILEEYKDRVRIFSIPNGGVSNARNEGIRSSTGDYIAFLDADDIWFRHKLKATAEAIRRYPQAGYIAGNYFYRPDDAGFKLKRHSDYLRRRGEIRYDEPSSIHPLRLILDHDFTVTPSTVVMKKSVAEEAGLFDRDRRLVEDVDFFLRVAMCTQFILLKDILVYKYDHKDSMSFNKLKLYLAHKDVLQHFYQKNKEFLDKNGFSLSVHRALSRICVMVGNLYFEAGKTKEAFAAYSEALNYDRALANKLRYLWTVFKKTIRVITGNRIARKKLGKAAG